MRRSPQMEFAQTLLRLLRLLEKLHDCRNKRQFWYPTPQAVWAHFRGLQDEEDDREGDDEQANDGKLKLQIEGLRPSGVWSIRRRASGRGEAA